MQPKHRFHPFRSVKKIGRMKSHNRITGIFYASLAISLVFILWAWIAPENIEGVLGTINDLIITNIGWFYLLSTTAFVLIAIFLIIGPFGRIRLGKPEDRPEYSYFTWFAFLFTAGMGVGLVFFGVAEPLTHYYSPPFADQNSTDAAAESLQYTLFHWGLHPWAIYSIVGLTLAYFKFRHQAPALISSAFVPLFGDRARGLLGHSIDVLAVFATLFGLSTSLGLGATQITAGLSFSFNGIENNMLTSLIVILVITILFITSATTGINRGIRYLSWGNVVLAIGVMIFVFILGSSVQMIEGFTTTLANYIQNFPSMTASMNVFSGDREFINNWTLFYWAWWIGWSPFVGTFIARVSRGRTIREFVIGVTGVPLLFSAIWFTIFGMASFEMDNSQGGLLYQLISQEGNEVAFFAFLESFPLSTIVIGLMLFLITSFFITSADAGTFALGMLTTGGSLNPLMKVKIIWGIILASTAAVLLWSGGLEALEMAMLIAAFPFALVIILMAVSLLKSLSNEYDILLLESKQREYDPKYQEKTKQELDEKREEFEKSIPSGEIEIADESEEEERQKSEGRT